MWCVVNNCTINLWDFLFQYERQYVFSGRELCVRGVRAHVHHGRRLHPGLDQPGKWDFRSVRICQVYPGTLEGKRYETQSAISEIACLIRLLKRLIRDYWCL